MIVLKGTDGVFLAAPAMMLNNHVECDPDSLYREENQPVWLTDTGIAVGVEGNPFLAMLLRTDPELRVESLDREYLLNGFLPKLKKRLEAFEKLVRDGNMPGRVLLATAKEAVLITGRFCLRGINGDEAFGADEDWALTAMKLTAAPSRQAHLYNIYSVGEKVSGYRLFPVSVVSVSPRTAERFLLMENGKRRKVNANESA